jgi:hypothetical protein
MITLIATRHSEKGKCTSNELLKIIEQISPEVIFEETPPDKFDLLYNNKLRNSLESKAIKMYLQKKPIVHFPVDMNIDKITENFFINDYTLMSQIFEQESAEYFDLVGYFNSSSAEYGFPYLNSAQCAKLLARKLILEAEVVSKVNHEELSKRYQNWLDINDARETEMIKNIYRHCSENEYASAIFLVGVEHRKRLMGKVAEYELSAKINLRWQF